MVDNNDFDLATRLEQGVRLYRCHLEFRRELAVPARNTQTQECESIQDLAARVDRGRASPSKSSCHWTACPAWPLAQKVL